MKAFPPECIQELETIDLADIIKKRPSVTGITIDSEVSQDLDDAIWIQAKGSQVTIQVHITDVSALFPTHSAIEKEARKRKETLYHTSPPSPMLPVSISTNIGSLREGEVRPTLTVSITLNTQAKIVDFQIQQTQLTSLKQFFYEEADEALSQPEHDFYLQLNYFNIWAKLLAAQRRRKGAIGCQMTQLGYIDENGILQPKLSFRSQQIIQELMLLANENVAHYLSSRGVTAIYRTHSANWELFQNQAQIDLLAIGDEATLRKRLAAYLLPAEYDTSAGEHFALASESYCHFTSPIRRFSDLINHRILKAVLAGKESPYSPEEITEIVTSLNRYQEKVKIIKNEVSLQRKKRELSQTMRRRAYAQLSSEQFSEMIHFATHSGKIQQLFLEIQSRSDQGKLSVVDYYYLIFESNHPELQQLAIEKVAAADASMVLNILWQKKGYQPNWLIEDIATKYLGRCEINAEGRILTIQPIIATSKKDAKHQSSLLWLQSFVAQKLLNPEQVQEITAIPELAAEQDAPIQNLEIPALGNENAVAWLNNFCQKKKLKQPKYTFTHKENVFVCTVALSFPENQYEVKGQGNSKKVAKTNAATAMVAKILEEEEEEASAARQK